MENDETTREDESRASGDAMRDGLVRALRGEAELKEVIGVDDFFVESVEQKAYNLYASGRYHTAETLLKGLAALDTGRVYPHMLLGDIALRTGRVDEAMRHLEAAMDADPDEPAISLKLGEALLRSGDDERAVEMLEHTRRLADADDSFAKRAETLLSQHAGRDDAGESINQ